MSREAKREASVVMAVYVGMLVLWHQLGGGFIIAYDLWHFLPWPLLLDDLGQSLLDLHAQPPILNLCLGLALKVARATTIRPEVWLYALQALLAGAGVFAAWWVAWRMVPCRWARWLALALILGNPYLYGQVNFFFYTSWEPALLAILAAAALNFFDRPTATRAGMAFAPAMVLVYTRALFHPLWIAGLAVVFLARAWRVSGQRGRIVAVSVAALALALAWPTKNFVRFGFFGASSWQGYNFWRGLPVGYPVAFEAFLRSPSEPPTHSVGASAQALVPSKWLAHPAVADLMKPPEFAPNWNHYAMIPISRELGASALSLVRQKPWVFGLRAIDYYVSGYSIYEAHGWEGDDAFVRDIEPAGRAWPRIYETVALLRFRAPSGNVTEITTGFTIVFPVLALMWIALLFRQRKRLQPESWVAVLMVFSVMWTLALVVFIDGAEGNRMRYGTQTFTTILIGWLACVAAASSRRRGAAQLDPEPDSKQIHPR